MTEVVSNATIAVTNRSIRFYAAGGTGINVLRAYREGELAKSMQAPQRANELFSYIDSSPANLVNANKADTFLLKGVDGSGSDRAKNVEACEAILPQVLLEHEAADFNVVIFGAAGGTGSVIGPMILEQLVDEGKTAVGIVLGAHETLKHTTNTIGTIMGMEDAVAQMEKTIAMYYFENDLSKTADANNQSARFLVGALSILASGRNGGLDSADVHNLFNFNNTTHHAPCLAQIQVFADEAALKAYEPRLVTMVALLKDRDQVAPQVQRDHGKVAYLSDTKAGIEQSLFFTVSIQAMSGIVENLNRMKGQAIKQRGVSETTAKLSDGTGKKRGNINLF